jgi:hypothetical protein
VLGEQGDGVGVVVLHRDQGPAAAVQCAQAVVA